MPANFVLLEKITVGAAGASSVTFSGIPQTGYTDLVVKVSARSTATNVNFDNFTFTFNGTSQTSNTGRLLYGTGSAAASASYSASAAVFSYPTANITANTFGSAEFYIPNYTGSTNKSFSADLVAENNATSGQQGLYAGLWSNTAAITSIVIAPTSANWVQYSTFYLYGVAKLGTTPAIVPYATGGDTIMTDGTYWYHTFISSGTFTPAKAITCDYLVVAGGGGSRNGFTGVANTGGGGAGGLRSTVTATGGGGSLESALSLGTSAYTVTVGAGGASGSNGSDSVFSTITSIGGGSAGSLTAGGSGGSGGGGVAFSPTYAGTGTANQGYNGANGTTSPNFLGGGGGGAGAVGGSNNGGTGVATSITGSSVTYAGGGGGGGNTAGTGGAGGGGNGTATGGAAGSAGTANTGGGGGGCRDTGTGGAGGSGIVIVRYAV
jgi:hypothetical protein